MESLGLVVVRPGEGTSLAEPTVKKTATQSLRSV